MVPEEIKVGLFIVEYGSVQKITSVQRLKASGKINIIFLESADGVTGMVENTCFRNNVDLAVEKWRPASEDQIREWRLSRVGYPVHWSAD